jgi:hypothetical protein
MVSLRMRLFGQLLKPAELRSLRRSSIYLWESVFELERSVIVLLCLNQAYGGNLLRGRANRLVSLYA